MAGEMYFASFKTAHDQATKVVDAILAADLHVNQIVTYNPSTKVMAAASTPTATNACIIALSDRSLGILDNSKKIATPYEHTPVEAKDLTYDGRVKASVSGAAKKVAIWPILDASDVTVFETTVVEQLR